jgi:hypothetical protein
MSNKIFNTEELPDVYIHSDNEPSPIVVVYMDVDAEFGSRWLTPDEARALATVLIQSADYAESK